MEEHNDVATSSARYFKTGKTDRNDHEANTILKPFNSY